MTDDTTVATSILHTLKTNPDSLHELQVLMGTMTISEPIQHTITNESELTTDMEAFWVSREGKKKKPTQLERYIAKKSPVYITKFIAIGGGPAMGTTLEEFARFRFTNLTKRKKGKDETGYDHIIKTITDIHVEQKSSGHWGEDDFKWQHVELAHKWNMLLLCGIRYTQIHFWGMSRETFQGLIETEKITNQGNKAGESSEGMWFNYSDVKDSLTEILTSEDLQAFAASL